MTANADLPDRKLEGPLDDTCAFNEALLIIGEAAVAARARALDAGFGPADEPRRVT